MPPHANASASITQLTDQIRAAVADQRVLTVQGGGTKAFYGALSKSDSVLSTQGLVGVCEHEPTELVVTVSAGMRLQDLQDILAKARQSLPFDPPHFGETATVGGMVAAGLSGPSRASVGGVRDYVLGVHLLSGQGHLLQFGGQVMKNVAGYDLSRIMAGSLGQLGVITQVSLKVLPFAAADNTVAFSWEQGKALAQLTAWAGLPLPIHASQWGMTTQGPRLLLRCQGAQAAVAAALDKFSREGGQVLTSEEAGAAWHGLREQSHPFFALAPGQCLWRLSVPDTTPEMPWPPMTAAHDTLVEWGGALRWIKAPAAAAPQIRAATAAVGGHATLFRCTQAQDKEAGVFGPLSPALQRIHQQLLAQLDPHGVFSTGRLGVSPERA